MAPFTSAETLSSNSGEATSRSLRYVKVIASGKGSLSVWASAHFTDNIIGQGGNHFAARHLSMSTMRFRAEGKGDLGVAIARSATYVGNSAERDACLFSLSVVGPALAANQGLNIVVL